MNKSNLTIRELLEKLKETNNLERTDYMAQSILPPDPITERKIASLKLGHYLLMPRMLEERFRFAGRWTNNVLSFTWLSMSDMENAWTDVLAQEAIGLRKAHWPTSVLYQHAPESLALFAIDVDDGNEIYLAFSGADEPEVVEYFGAQEKRYNSLQDYLQTWTT